MHLWISYIVNKISWDTLPYRTFPMFFFLTPKGQNEAIFIPNSPHKYCAAVQAMSRKQHFNTPTLNAGEGD